MHKVREFAELAFATAGINIAWKGTGVEERGFNLEDLATPIVQIDQQYYRPTEVEPLLGVQQKQRK